MSKFGAIHFVCFSSEKPDDSLKPTNIEKGEEKTRC